MRKRPEYASPARRCNARAKTTGKTCRYWAVAGGTKCRYHGGLSLRGIASPRYRHGMYSKYLPVRMREMCLKAMDDPELLALGPEIALTDSRTVDLLKRVDSGESGALWQQLRASWQAFMEARVRGDTEGMRVALEAHEVLLTRGQADYAAWDAVGRSTDRRQRLVETEHKHRVQHEYLITIERVNMYLNLVADIINNRVKELIPEPTMGHTLIAAISNDLQGLSLPADVN